MYSIRAHQPSKAIRDLWIILIFSVLLTTNPSFGASNIQRDGSLGVGPTNNLTTSGTLNNNNITYQKILIPENYGQRVGANIFHSFKEFNIGTSDAALFTTTANIQTNNVISRVTGGNASYLNGLLQLSAGDGGGFPNFYLINPSGVIFGQGASINVPAGFHVSTGDYLKMGPNRFYADLQHTSNLSSSDPDAFGFLGNQRNTISIRDGALLIQNNESTLSLAAGDISLDNGSVLTNGGDIRLAAVGNKISEIGLGGTLAPTQGRITLDNRSNISSTGSNRNGDISIASGYVFILNDSVIASETNGSTKAGDLNINAGGGITLENGGYFSTSARTDSSGDSGALNVVSNFIHVDGNCLNRNQCGRTGFFADTFGSGASSNIKIDNKNDFDILDGGLVRTSTMSNSHNSSNIEIATKNLFIDGRHNPIYTGIFTQTKGSGQPGLISIIAREGVAIRDKGAIFARSYSSMPANSIAIRANKIDIIGDGNDSDHITGIFSLAHGNGGGPGDINITLDQALTIQSGGQINSSAFIINGHNSKISINTNSLLIDGQGIAQTGIYCVNDSPEVAGVIEINVKKDINLKSLGEINATGNNGASGGKISIQSESLNIDANNYDGDAQVTGVVSEARYCNGCIAAGLEQTPGSISIKTRTLQILRGATITASTASNSEAGRIDISADRILIDGGGTNTGIYSVAWPESSGRTGYIKLKVDSSLNLFDMGSISIDNFSSFLPPLNFYPTNITVDAKSIILKNASISAQSLYNIPSSSIFLNFSDLLYLDPSIISTLANNGNAGLISIDGGKSGVVILERSKITTSVEGLAGNGGDIHLNSKALILNNGFIQADTAATNASGGDIMLNVDAIIPSMSNLFLGGSQPYSFGSSIPGYNVIQAASPGGVNGNIAISAPQLDISGSLGMLNADTKIQNELGRSPCRLNSGSSLVLMGFGGISATGVGYMLPAVNGNLSPSVGARMENKFGSNFKAILCAENNAPNFEVN